MEIRHLRLFVAVAEELHFTRAAARLRTAQPSLSQQIRRLERELGAELFIRTNRSVELTDAGRVFLEHAHRVLDEAGQAKLAVHRAMQGDLGSLTIGIAPNTAYEPLCGLFASYRARHPEVDLQLRELRNRQQLEALSNGQISIGLGTSPVDDPRLRSLLLQRLRLVVALPANHRLATRQDLRLGELAGERWVHPQANTGPLYTACVEAGFEPLTTQAASEHTTRMMLVASGLGIALDFESAPRLRSRHIVYRTVIAPGLTVDLLATWRADRSSPLIDGFVDIARSIPTPPDVCDDGY